MSSNTNKTISNVQYRDSVVLHGYLKKLKTMKKKYFVLYEDCGKSPARLEYFENEKKFKSKANPKRSITLISCININRCFDTKHEYVISLSTKDDGFGIVMDSEDDMNNWLRTMLKLQTGPNIFSDSPKPYYEHVWQVVVQRKGLAEKKGILGSYHVCLSSKSVTLIRIGSERTNVGEQRVPVIEFFLTSIRRCGDSKCYFYMEVGRHSIIGAGELWMETKDNQIAQNMHTMILNVMSTNADDPYGPMRKRSSSATETSKPVTILQRRQTHSGGKTITSSPINTLNRDRCDSLPSSRNRNNSESGYNKCDSSSMPPSRTMSSLSTVPSLTFNRRSHSPSINNNALSPSVGCLESDGSTLSIDETDSLKQCHPTDDNASFAARFYSSHSPGGVILEENCDEFSCAENKNQNIVPSSILNKSNIYGGIDLHGGLNSTRNRSIDIKSQYLDLGNSISEYMEMDNSSKSHYINKDNATNSETVCCDTNLASAKCNSISYENSRTPSFTEEAVDGYVHMSPQTSDYIDMEQSMKNIRSFSNTNPGTSYASGIPLKGISFAEYSLEKINPKIFPDEDEMLPLKERPPRAYSVGSRMEHHNQKLRIEVIGNSEQNHCRVRAFSVGSRSKVPRCDLQRNILMANVSNAKKINFGTSKTSISSQEPSSESTGRDRKSSSAPLLIHKSQNSVDRMDDLMEIDFSKNVGIGSNSHSLQSTGASSFNIINSSKNGHFRGGVLESSPGQITSTNKPNNKRSDPIQIRRDNGYLEMRPVIYSQFSDSYDESTECNVSVKKQSVSPEVSGSLAHRMKLEDSRKIETPEGYLEMSWSGKKDNSSSFKSWTPTSSIYDKKAKSISKMQSLLNNCVVSTTSNTSKFSVLQEPNKIVQYSQKSASIKPETAHRKRLPDLINNSFTISEEKTINTNLSEKFKQIFIQFSLQHDKDFSNYSIDLSTADYECYNYLHFTVGIERRNAEKTVPGIDNSKDDYCNLKAGPNHSLQKLSSLHTKAEVDDNKCGLNKIDSINSMSSKTEIDKDINRDSKRTPISSYSQPLRNHRSNNSNLESGYELLHICSDSSLQTKTNISRPSSVNSDRIFPIDRMQYRPNPANNDFLKSNSVSSSPAGLCFSSYLSQNSCDNRCQEPLRSETLNNNGEDKKMNTDSASSKGLKQHDLTSGQRSPSSKSVAVSQAPTNSELELHYASLDLPISSIHNSIKTIGALHNPAKTSTAEDNQTRLSPNPNLNTNNSSQQSAFTYAKIDFNQCEIKKIRSVTQHNL
ncbi:insulin receptor substrate 1 [Episyrphus balteatus]|uniref:insulin receptor substrate 1 n=1 Tax=Episyrphus balteatus TaxID=286459 RepID=UPI0024855E09|nr:insulin receptor substrate 1 [Episyrphus balteatus]XP_055837578.1 insulin receptor substrate 1 [Episyrphus balteatus]XP_055837579.1 insulin receptor substrate 1 [Episyrphus balteatus]XP_055837580.1 insulin receptor substrate 1 [Episyrphus balteatus]XP_055837581.1 insulin receptor substrate 1 [Episyrphus balteatus]XP_055837582.1 insulin receptor substrate 1 [Episyrphus balteatus]